MIGVSDVVAATVESPNLMNASTCVPPEAETMRACWPTHGSAVAAEAEPDEEAEVVGPGVKGGMSDMSYSPAPDVT